MRKIINNKVFYKIILLVFSFSWASMGCEKKIQYEPCTCIDYNVGRYIDSTEGVIYFRTNPVGYSLYMPQIGGFSGNGTICLDSIFLNQLKKKQVKDSSTIKFSFGYIFNDRNTTTCEEVQDSIDRSALDGALKVKVREIY
jgi:hypothetical protein